MKIGIVIGRIGGEDGVALETEKWITVLQQRMGHQVEVLAGELEGAIRNVTLLPELDFFGPSNTNAQNKAFFGATTTEKDLMAELDGDCRVIQRGILSWIDSKKIECLVSENANALPFHLTLGWAIKRVLERTGLPAVTHDHDFRWERGSRYDTPYAGVQKILEQCYPLKMPTVKHGCINTPAQQTLAKRCGITDAVVVPNVMDFDRPYGLRDHYNADLREELSVAHDDKLLFQITRIVRRKGIETAIDLVHRLNDPKVKLVITGTAKDDDGGDYIDELAAQAERLGIKDQVLFVGDRFDNQRRTNNGRKVYALWDAYAHATAMTYFSTYEGFGNAYVECVNAKVPIFVNNYEPVYWPDIGSLGFKTAQIDKAVLTDRAVEQMRQLINDPALQREQGAHNYEIGKEHFSYRALERVLRQLFPTP